MEDKDQARPEEKKEHWDQLLRLKAEFENTKKRLEREKIEAIKFANERLLAEILPVVDNFDRAMASISEGHDPEKVKKGLGIAQEQIHQILELHGVQVVKCLGKDFDPKLHEAVAVVEANEGVKDGTVVDEIQKGYLLNGRLIRPSKVRIAQNLKENPESKEQAQ
ncbi:MAG: nucleotide exchange factor GrpE [Candidatus Omnitrophica bacterium]|nr:nucleotide exchange factor GrpE [Candidatus Omnitrophota bacterium]